MYCKFNFKRRSIHPHLLFSQQYSLLHIVSFDQPFIHFQLSLNTMPISPSLYGLIILPHAFSRSTKPKYSIVLFHKIQFNSPSCILLLYCIWCCSFPWHKTKLIFIVLHFLPDIPFQCPIKAIPCSNNVIALYWSTISLYKGTSANWPPVSRNATVLNTAFQIPVVRIG